MSKILEIVPPSEDAVIAEMVKSVLDKQRKTHVPGTTARRDVHAKSHGAVEITFQVFKDIPDNCRVGLFANPGMYSGVVRFSNGAFGYQGADIFPNIRGIALKLRGVKGPKVIPGEEQSEEHDFLMANHRTFFVPRIENMLALTQGKMGDLVKQSPKALWYLLRSLLKLVKNPLQTKYFSQVPYRLGDAACKYALIPAEHASLLSFPNGFDRDYMRHSIERRLKKGNARFLFCVQLQQANDSLEDSTIGWNGPLVPVAEVTFPQSERPIPPSDGEVLSFNPWRVLEAHEPLGWPGRTRRAVYAADFEWRTKENRGSTK